jgi:hypothetical protein
LAGVHEGTVASLLPSSLGSPLGNPSPSGKAEAADCTPLPLHVHPLTKAARTVSMEVQHGGATPLEDCEQPTTHLLHDDEGGDYAEAGPWGTAIDLSPTLHPTAPSPDDVLSHPQLATSLLPSSLGSPLGNPSPSGKAADCTPLPLHVHPMTKAARTVSMEVQHGTPLEDCALPQYTADGSTDNAPEVRRALPTSPRGRG